MTKHDKMDSAIQILREKGYSLSSAYAYAFGALSMLVTDEQADTFIAAVKGRPD